MPQRRILVAKRPVNRSLVLSAQTSTSASSAFVASSTRLNTHVLLGLSMLALSVNARPLDTSGGTGNTGFAGLLNGNAAEWDASGKGGIGGQLADSFLKMLHLNGGNVEQQSDDTLLDDIVRPASPTPEYPALMTGSTTADSAATWDSSDIQEKRHMFESLLHQNPALSFVLGVTDLMHRMRELFVDIAIIESEERGIFIGEQTSPEIQNVGEDSLLEQAYAGEEVPSSALGLRLHSEEQRVPAYPSVSVEDDPPMFDLDDVNNSDGLIVPGQFTPTVKEPSLESSPRPQEMAFENLNPSVNPYAALALSSVLATLFVVGVVVGRHYYLSMRENSGERNVEDELERGGAVTTGRVDGSKCKKPAPAQPSAGSGHESAVELDEKVAMELEPHIISQEIEVAVQPVGSNDASANELDEKTAMELQSNTSPADFRTSSEEVEAKEALALLIDVANAALASTTSASAGANTARTPKAVSSAIETLRSEVSRTPQTRHLHLVLPGSRPGTPSTPPIRPRSVLGGPAIVVAIDEGVNIGSNVVVENEKFNLSRPGSPDSNASSFVSAYSHMPGGALSIGRASGRNVGRTVLASAFVAQRTLAIPQPSRVVSPAPSSGAGGASPALSTMSYATAIEAPSTPARRREQDSQPLNATFHTPPTRPTSPGYCPQPPGALNFFGDYGQYHGEEWPVDEREMKSTATGASGGVQMRPAMLPPAQLTQTALELALMLPATEWIFQFIVVFIGWFGFWMRPVGTGPRGPSRG